MASRKVRLKIDTADDVVDHREPKPNLNPVVTRPRPPPDALPLPPLGEGALLHRGAHKIPIAPLSGGGARKSPTTETGVDTKAASTK